MDERFEELTERARRVLRRAQGEAQSARGGRHAEVRPEHLLLAMLQERGSMAARVLERAGVNFDRARDAVQAAAPPADDPVEAEAPPESASSGPWLDATALSALDRAVAEAQRMQRHYVGTEHLLLGLAQAPESVPGRVLGDLGLDAERLRREAQQVLSGWQARFREALSERGGSPEDAVEDVGTLAAGPPEGVSRAAAGEHAEPEVPGEAGAPRASDPGHAGKVEAPQEEDHTSTPALPRGDEPAQVRAEVPTDNGGPVSAGDAEILLVFDEGDAQHLRVSAALAEAVLERLLAPEAPRVIALRLGDEAVRIDLEQVPVVYVRLGEGELRPH